MGTSGDFGGTRAAGAGGCAAGKPPSVPTDTVAARGTSSGSAGDRRRGAAPGRPGDGRRVTDSFRRMDAWVVVATLVLGGGCAPAPFHGFRTEDGFGIAADLALPAGEGPAPLVVAGHQLYRDRHSWDPLVPALTKMGFAVLTLDHRGFGESTKEAASPADLSVFERERMDRDFLDAIEAVRDDARVDARRVVLMASGVSVGPAVRAASRSDAVVALVLFPGLIDVAGREFLMEHPDLPVLLLAAGGEIRGRDAVRQYALRFTGEAQEYLEIPPGPDDPADWEGTDGLAAPSGAAEAITWFLERHVTGTPAP